MLAAPTTSRWPLNPQNEQRKVRPLGLGTLLRQSGQVEEVPRSFTSTTSIPAISALSFRAAMRWVRPQLRSRRFWTLPTSRLQIPSGSPTRRVPTRWSIAQATTALAAWWCAWRMRRRWRAPARRWVRPHLGQRLDPRLRQQGQRADGLLRVGHRPPQVHHQRRGSPPHRDPEAVAVDAERAVVPAHRQQGLLAAGEACMQTGLPPLRRLKPLGGVAPE